jgi:DHA2 family methylenomycin A resistance protein-like MFS transporter
MTSDRFSPGWRTFTALMLGPFIALLDTTIVNVALPSIGTGLHATTTGLQWVVDAYTLSLSALLLSGGSLGDRYGRRRLYGIGIAAFTIASAACAASPTPGALITARAVQGAAAALLMTGAMSLLVQAYQDPRKRAEMIGLYSMIGGSSVVLGPVLGGLLVDTVGWRTIFVVNLPIGALALWLVRNAIPESADPAHAAIDPAGQLSGLILLASLTYGLIESRDHGWSSAVTLTALVVAAIAAVAFVWVERRAEHPMLPVSLFTDAAFTIPNLASFVLGFGTSAVFFLLSLYLQQVQGHSAASTGLRFLPLTVAICLTAPIAGRLTGRHGPYRIMIVGYLISGAALIGLVLLQQHTGTAAMALWSILLGVGMGASISPTQLAGVLALPRERSGLASACINTTRQSGTALGVAILGLIVATQAGDTPGQPGFADGFVRGLHIAGLLSGLATIAAALLVAVLATRRTPSAAAPAPDPLATTPPAAQESPR